MSSVRRRLTEAVRERARSEMDLLHGQRQAASCCDLGGFWMVYAVGKDPLRPLSRLLELSASRPRRFIMKKINRPAVPA